MNWAAIREAAERSGEAVLAAVMISPELFGRVELTPEQFPSPKQAAVWRSMGALAEDGRAIDVRTIEAEAAKEDSSVSLAYLAQLDLALPSLDGLSEYAETVREFAARRELLEQMREQSQRLKQGDEVGAVTTVLADGIRRAEEGKSGRKVGIRVDELGVLSEEWTEREGASTGFPRLDRMTRGLEPGKLVIVCGRPGMGKTVLGLQMAASPAIRDERPSLFVSLEMSNRELFWRFMAAETGVPMLRLKTAHISDRERREVVIPFHKRWGGVPLFLEDELSEWNSICSAARRMAWGETGLGVLTVDYLQLMDLRGTSEPLDRLEQITKSAKRLSRELDITVILLAQLNRNAEGREPQKSDLRGSGTIEQDADLIISPYRPGEWEVDEDLKRERAHEARFIVLKNRNGRTGSIDAYFDGPCFRFTEEAKENAA